MNETVELRCELDGERVKLLSPAVGLCTETIASGDVLSPGQRAGVLLVLGRAVHLVVPEGVQGRVVGPDRERMQTPVGYGDVVYELEPLAASTSSPAATEVKDASSNALVLRSPQSGRFYHRSAPGEPAFASAGAVVSDGQPVGLIEVMKTFTHVVYRANSTLPPRAKLTRYVARDGSEVRANDVLLEFEST